MLFVAKSNPLLRAQTILLRRLKTLTSTDHDAPIFESVPKDDYFAAIHHISNIVRRDIYMERTLNKIPINVNSELVYRVLRSCSNSGTEAFRFFNWARTHPTYEPTTIEFEEIVRILSKAKRYETMWKVIEQMRTSSKVGDESHCGISPSLVCYIIEEFGRHGLTSQAVEVFNKAKHLGCLQTTEVYNALLFALCEGKLFHGAYALIRRMIRKGGTPNKRTYAVLVNAWCSNGKMREAQEFLEEMSRKGFSPPVRGRDLLIDGLLNAGYVEAAKEMVRKMIKEGQLPDIETFNTLMEAICKSGEVEFCIDVYRDACDLGLCTDLNTYRILIPSFCKVGRIDEAFRLLHCSVEDGHKPYPSLYAPILKTLCKTGQFDDAFSFFSDMKLKGHPPNRPVYTMLIKMCTRGGKFIDAANYLVEMTEMSLVPMSQCFDMVTDGLKSCGKHDLAKRMEHLEVSLRRA